MSTSRLLTLFTLLAITLAACAPVTPVGKNAPSPFVKNGVLHVASGSDLENAMAKGNAIVLVNFTSDMCVACRTFSKTYARAAGELGKKKGITFVSASIDHDLTLLDLHDIEAVPTTLIFKEGVQIRELQGTGSFEALMTVIDEVLNGF